MKYSEIFSDRYVRGSIAGVAAGIAMNAVSALTVGVLNLGEDLATDYMAEMLFGRQAMMLMDKIISFMAHLLFTGFLGVLFSFMLLLVGSKFILFKGITFAWAAWFILYSVGILFEVPLLKTNTASTVTTHFITASVYGLTLAALTAYLEKKGTLR